MSPSEFVCDKTSHIASRSHQQIELNRTDRNAPGHIAEWHLVLAKAVCHITFGLMSWFSEKAIVFGVPFSESGIKAVRPKRTPPQLCASPAEESAPSSYCIEQRSGIFIGVCLPLLRRHVAEILSYHRGGPLVLDARGRQAGAARSFTVIEFE